MLGLSEESDPVSVAVDYCDTVNSNIESFLKDKSMKMEINLETINKDFENFWHAIGAKGNIDNALEELKTCYNTSEQNGVFMPDNIKYGGELLNDGKVREAESIFLNLLEKQPENLEAINYLGIISFQRGEVEKSVDYFTKALTIDPYYKNAVYNICEVFRTMNNLAVVKPLLNQVLEKYPDDEKLIMLIEEANNLDTPAHSLAENRKEDINTEDYWDNSYQNEIGIFEWRRNVVCFGKIKSVLGVLGDSNDIVLDIGCGYGLLLDLLKPVGFQLRGWDISGKAINRVIEKGFYGRRIDFTEYTYSDDDVVDHVVSSELLEHVRDPDAILEKMYQLARKTIIISVPDNCLGDEDEHLQCFDEVSLRSLVELFSFKKIFIDRCLEEFMYKTPAGSTRVINRPTLLAVLVK